MYKTYRVLGKRGRITIPYELRMRVGFAANDILSFTIQEDHSVIVKREKICDNCKPDNNQIVDNPSDSVNLMDFLDRLSEEEQRSALIYLSVKWARQNNKGGCKI